MKVRGWLCLMAAVVLLFMGNYYRNSARETLFCLIFLSEGEEFSVEDFESDAEEAMYTFTLWEEQKNVYVSSARLGRTAQADVLQIYGQSRLLLPYGKNILPEDTEGCLIGEALSQSLFGSEAVEGQQLMLGERVLTVRGVVCEPKQVLICETETKGKDYRPDHISVAMDENKDTASMIRSFMRYYGISATAVRYDYYLYPIPLGELLPGKWSDFDGWRTNLAAYREALQVLGNIPRSCIEELYMKKIRQGYICLALGVLLGIGILLYMHPRQNSAKKIKPDETNE